MNVNHFSSQSFQNLRNIRMICLGIASNVNILCDSFIKNFLFSTFITFWGIKKTKINICSKGNTIKNEKNTCKELHSTKYTLFKKSTICKFEKAPCPINNLFRMVFRVIWVFSEIFQCMQKNVSSILKMYPGLSTLLIVKY